MTKRSQLTNEASIYHHTSVAVCCSRFDIQLTIYSTGSIIISFAFHMIFILVVFLHYYSQLAVQCALSSDRKLIFNIYILKLPTQTFCPAVINQLTESDNINF